MSSPYTLNTASGALLDLEDPAPEAIRLEDIAGALSRICRFGAQTKTFYSVAQHAVEIQRLVIESGYPDLTLAALHHDSHEAYICDLPSPLKRLINRETPVYSDIADRLDAAIAAAFGFVSPEADSRQDKAIKECDLRMLLVEAEELLPDRGEAIRRSLSLGADDLRDLRPLATPLLPHAAERAFLDAQRAACTNLEADVGGTSVAPRTAGVTQPED